MDANKPPPGPRPAAAKIKASAKISKANSAAKNAAAAAAAVVATKNATAHGNNKGRGPPGARKNSGNRQTCVAERCPLCHRARQSFHCQSCVANGEFGHSSRTTADKDKFSKKQAKLETISYSSSLYKNDCAKMIARKQQITDKKIEILLLRNRVENIKLAISDKNKVITEKRNQLQQIKQEIDDQVSRVDRYDKRVIRLEQFKRNQEIVLDHKTNELHLMRPEVKRVTKKRLDQLVTHIFCLDEVHPDIVEQEEQEDSNNLSHALTEASQLTYICGQWVNTCEEWSRQTEFGYRIVAPILPANGNYSAYNKWVLDKSKDYAANQDYFEPNPACRISAGLTYTSQLVRQLSFFLNVFLLRRPNFNEFCGNELSPTKFTKYVTHLNANVLYLCFSQNVDPKFLNLDHTLKNVLMLLDTTYSDLGRFGPLDISSSMCKSLEDKITLRLLLCTQESDSEDENYREWESVTSGEFSPEQSQSSLDSTSSIVRAGLVASTAASIASMWRGWNK